MAEYKDFNFVKYVLDLPFYDGLLIYNKCLGRSKKFEENRIEDKQFQMYLIEMQYNGFDGSFEDYKNNQNIVAETNCLTKEEKEKEEKRLINDAQKIINIDKKRKV